MSASSSPWAWIVPVASAASGSRPSGICFSRRQALRVLLIGGGGGVVAVWDAGRCWAAVPTIDDYNGTDGGAVKKVNGNIGPGGGKEAGGSSSATRVTVDGERGLAARDDVELALRGTEDALAEMKKLVEQLAWDDVRTLIKTSTLGVFTVPTTKQASPKIKSPFLRNMGLLRTVYGPNYDRATEAAEDAAVTLKRLNDFAFSNRVIFFNSIDRRQVSELADTMSVDLTEPMELLDSLEDTFRSLRRLVVAEEQK